MATRDDDQRQVTNWDHWAERAGQAKARRTYLALRTRKGHDRWAAALDDTVVGIYHFRVRDTRHERKTPAWTHIHVVMLSKGYIHIGVHRTPKNKQYVRKIGYTASLGKALASAVRSAPDAMADFSEMNPTERYTAMQQLLQAMDRLRP